ncbi:MAG: DUF1476 family protein [Alphaproteobacteria bacterium]|nr:DUF1476 family protein [Alphaproteobacteria bacterium]
MGGAFKDREKAAEAKWAHDEEMRFKVMARRNKLLGLWAAEFLGRTDADAYAKDVIASDFQEAGDEDVFRKIRGDFDAKSVALSDHAIRSKMEELLAVAGEQIMTEAGK